MDGQENPKAFTEGNLRSSQSGDVKVCRIFHAARPRVARALSQTRRAKSTIFLRTPPSVKTHMSYSQYMPYFIGQNHLCDINKMVRQNPYGRLSAKILFDRQPFPWNNQPMMRCGIANFAVQRTPGNRGCAATLSWTADSFQGGARKQNQRGVTSVVSACLWRKASPAARLHTKKGCGSNGKYQRGRDVSYCNWNAISRPQGQVAGGVCPTLKKPDMSPLKTTAKCRTHSPLPPDHTTQSTRPLVSSARHPAGVSSHHRSPFTRKHGYPQDQHPHGDNAQPRNVSRVSHPGSSRYHRA